MKLETLLEMPDYIKKEMPVINASTVNFYSEDTINREFNIIGKTKSENSEYWTIIKKNKSFAVIGELVVREEDKRVGIKLVGQLDFKDKPDFAFDRLISIPESVLQVDSVVVYSNKFKGMGFNLYLSLVKYGYIIVSDHTQYEGGKKLWEKIARLSSAKEYSVFIVDNGEPRTDSDGNIIEYDGTNLKDDTIWGDVDSKIENSRRYVLLVMKRK